MDRHLAIPLHRAMHESPVVAPTGPRRAGKASLARREFPALPYVNLADHADRARARENPAAFLGSLRGRAIVDEAHRAPELLAALATPAGAAGATQLLLLAPVKLARQARELHLYPPSLAERERRPPAPLEVLARYRQPATPGPSLRLETLLAEGGRNETSLEQDARALIGLHDADRFLRFTHLAAAGSGSIIDQSRWAGVCGVAHTTAARWLDALERLFYLVRPPAASDSSGRRLVKRRKLFFLDLAWVPAAERFAAWGAAEVVKGLAHTGQAVELTHWATATGLETGLIAHTAAGPVSVSFARWPTAPPATLRAARQWQALHPLHAACVFVTGGAGSGLQEGVAVLPWWLV